MSEEKANNIEIKCQDCGNIFIFSADEQKFYEEKGYVPPKRCKSCRNARTLRKNRANY